MFIILRDACRMEMCNIILNQPFNAYWYQVKYLKRKTELAFFLFLYLDIRYLRI